MHESLGMRLTTQYRSMLSVLAMLFALSGCVMDPANPSLAGLNNYSKQQPTEPESTLEGVINGLWEYNPEWTRGQLQKHMPYLSAAEIEEYSQRYAVRVGINRAVVIPLPVTVLRSEASTYVLLPAGWSHSLSGRSPDPKVINVGDIVRVRVQPGRRFDFVEDLVRKCDAPALPSENRDWNIGCKTYKKYTKWGHNGYAGERYFLTSF